MNIILQHWSGPISELTEISIVAYKKYADIIGCDYKLVEGNAFNNVGDIDPPVQKLCMLNKEFDEYDNVLMVDCDSLPVKSLRDNVFDVPGIGLFNDWVATHAWRRIQATHPRLSSINHPYWGGSFYKIDRELRVGMRNVINEKEISQFYKRYHDEGIMHRLATLCNVSKVGAYIPDIWSQCSYYPVTSNTKMIHIRPKMEPRDNSPRRPKIETYYDFKSKGIFE